MNLNFSILRMFLPKIIGLLVVLCAVFVSCGRKNEKIQTPSKKPNIIVILADDMGYGDAQVYNDESKIPTPNINALAENGIRFTDAHSPSSVCTPTRYGILTGRYAWRTPLKKSVLWMWDKPLIEKDRMTLPKMLKSKGYSTACIGKWHLGWRWPGGHRVPFIVSWPKMIKKGSVSNQLFCLTDLMATFGSVVGITSWDLLLEDSYDMSDVLVEKPVTHTRQDIVHHSIDGTFSLRKGDWKLILETDSGGFSKNLKIEGIPVTSAGQLYNLSNDLSEKDNMYADRPEIVTELTVLLDRYKEQGYSHPNFNK